MRSSAKESSALRSLGKVNHSLGVDEEGIVVVAMNEIKKMKKREKKEEREKSFFFLSLLFVPSI